MPVTNYDTIDGRIVGENTGGVQTNYMLDALGSVVGTKNLGGVVQNTYRHKPYGGLLAKTGTAADPKFLWNGGSGYRVTQRAHSDVYVRARHFGSAEGRWTSTDPLWPELPSYGYSRARAVTFSDASGRCATNGNTVEKITMTVTPNPVWQVAVMAPGWWRVEAYLDVSYLCTITHSPCFHGTKPPGIYIKQWASTIAPGQYGDWSVDGTPACGPATGDCCSASQQGKDAPGFVWDTWVDQGTSCEVLYAPESVYASMLPFSAKGCFVACCTDCEECYWGDAPPPAACPGRAVFGYNLSITPGGYPTLLNVALTLNNSCTT